ncbi:MAG TPA: ubiquitin-like protein UBact [Chthoniobacterales bacterium]|nr:ubiquitin-like protein UBact [Chthoniobacterales bacterium]
MQRPPVQSPWERKSGDDSGPKAPNISKPDTNSLLKRLRSIDPDQSRKYRQRSGQ